MKKKAKAGDLIFDTTGWLSGHNDWGRVDWILDDGRIVWELVPLNDEVESEAYKRGFWVGLFWKSEDKGDSFVLARVGPRWGKGGEMLK